MLAELPFTTAEDIAAEYKPGSGVTVKAALRTLRGKDVISEGLGVRPRGSGGRVSGERHLYSSLNLDAVRLHRRGDDKAARRLARRAAGLERRKETQWLAAELAPVFGQHTALHDAIQAVWSSDARSAARVVAEQTEAVRSALQATLGARTFAYIVKLHGDLADLRIEGSGRVMPMPTSDLLPNVHLMIGAGVSLRWESLGNGFTLLKAAAALELEDDAEELYPYERPLPSEDSRVELTGALASEPTIRSPRRISIGGSK